MDEALIQGSIEYQQAHPNESHIPNIIAGFTIGLVLAYVGIAARLFSRHLIGARLKIDDYLAIVALIGTTAYCVINLTTVGLYNFGKHQVYVTDSVTVTKLVTTAEVVYAVPIFCFKASICTLLMRLFPVRWFRWSQIALIAFVFAYTVISIVVVLLECMPIAKVWNPNVPGRCLDINTALTVVSAFNIITDFVILVLPMPLLWKLNMSTARKCQLTLMIGLGALVFIASIVRITTLKGVSLLDPSYSDAIPAIWSAVEMGLGTLGVCMPTYGPLITYCRGGRTEVDRRKNATPEWSKRSTEKQYQSDRPMIRQNVDDDDYHLALSTHNGSKISQKPHTTFSVWSETQGKERYLGNDQLSKSSDSMRTE